VTALRGCVGIMAGFMGAFVALGILDAAGRMTGIMLGLFAVAWVLTRGVDMSS
jgi:hypothetical protein